MAHLTPDEADRIIRACTDASGFTSDALMSGWKTMMLVMLDRLEMERDDADGLSLCREVVELWSSVEPANTYPPDYQFMYRTDEVDNVKGWYGELNRLTLAALMRFIGSSAFGTPLGVTMTDRFEEIQKFITGRLDTLDDIQKAGGMFYLTAGELCAVRNVCMSLISMVLGAARTEAFQQQYNACIGSWSTAARFIGKPRSMH